MKTFTLMAAVLAAGMVVEQAAAQQPLGIGTSPQGTLTYQIGATYGQAVTEELGRQTRVQPQSGTGVMVPLVDSGELDIGFVNTLEMTGGPSMVYGAEALRAYDAFSGARTG